MTKRCRHLNQIRVTSIEVDGVFLIFCIILPSTSGLFFLQIDKERRTQRACDRQCDRDP